MQPPSIEHARRERQRLAALHGLQVLDTARAQCFQRVTALASRLFELPIASISFVDAGREWCLARCGPIPDEQPRERSLAELVVAADELIAVEDATSHVVLARHPLVTGPPAMRFFAGCPVRAEGSVAVGALYVAALDVRSFRPVEAQMLRDLAGVVEDELALRFDRCFDPESGLLTRRGFEIVGSHVCARARRRGEPVSLVVVGLEHEHVPPIVLRELAGALGAVTRASDVAARLPLDELAVLLPDTDAAGCELVCERLDSSLQRTGIAGGQRAWRLGTVSLDPRQVELSLPALLRSVTDWRPAAALGALRGEAPGSLRTLRPAQTVRRLR